jgi:predicted nucleic acid-binding protein
MYIRKNKDSEVPKRAIKTLSRLMEVTEEIADCSAVIHARIRKSVKDFELVDAFVMALAESCNGKIVTKDLHFKHFRNVLFI